MNDVQELYQELIVDHYKNPYGKEAQENPDNQCTLLNPLCGDEVTVFVAMKGGHIEKLSFIGKGCAISQASASMMSELCEGLTKEEAIKRLETFTEMMQKNLSDDELEPLGDAASLKGVKRFAARIRCAMLGWEALAVCLKDSVSQG